MLDGVLDISKLFSPSADGLIAKVTLGCGDSAYTTTDLSFKVALNDVNSVACL
jgi:hypothetical protein